MTIHPAANFLWIELMKIYFYVIFDGFFVGDTAPSADEATTDGATADTSGAAEDAVGDEVPLFLAILLLIFLRNPDIIYYSPEKYKKNK